MPRLVCLVLLATFFCTGPREVAAIPTFQKVMFPEYFEKHKDKEFAEMATKKAKCFVCHQGKKKSNRNAYGVQLARFLDKKKNKDIKDPKNVELIKKAIAAVGRKHSDPKDKKSLTYDEMIKKSLLPGGKLEDVQKEPTEKQIEERKKEEKREVKKEEWEAPKKGSDKKGSDKKG